jgi:hypothetical protein
MKTLALDVDTHDTKRINLPLGKVLVGELKALINGPLAPLKRIADKNLNELAERALDDIITRINDNEMESMDFINDFRRKRYEYAEQIALTNIARKRPIQDYENENEPNQKRQYAQHAPHTPPHTPHAPAQHASHAPHVPPSEPITRMMFDELVFDLQKSFENSNDNGRRIAYNYLRQAKRVLDMSN